MAQLVKIFARPDNLAPDSRDLQDGRGEPIPTVVPPPNLHKLSGAHTQNK